MNELPDLSPKIQVGLFNVLEERDVQIRGFTVRLALDVCMVFSANPEDYTNRGRIVTPLKDRIGSVVRTHYPLTRELGMQITDANAWSARDDGPRMVVPQVLEGDRRRDVAIGPKEPACQPGLGRQRPDVDRQLREPGLECRTPGPRPGRAGGRRPA